MRCYLISNAGSCVISAIDCSVRFVLGFTSDEIVGHSIEIFQGPATDRPLLRSLLTGAAGNHPCTRVPVSLHDKSGQQRSLLVSCRLHDGHDDTLELILEHVPEMSSIHSENVDHLDAAWALLSVIWPHGVERVNPCFSALLEMDATDIVGQNLHRIKPRHAMSAAWRVMFRSASVGQAARDFVEVRCGGGREFLADVTCIPVLSGPPDMRQSHMLAVIADASASTKAAGLSSSTGPASQTLSTSIEMIVENCVAEHESGSGEPTLAAFNNEHPVRQDSSAFELSSGGRRSITMEHDDHGVGVGSSDSRDREPAAPIPDDAYLRRTRRRHLAVDQPSPTGQPAAAAASGSHVASAAAGGPLEADGPAVTPAAERCRSGASDSDASISDGANYSAADTATAASEPLAIASDDNARGGGHAECR